MQLNCSSPLGEARPRLGQSGNSHATGVTLTAPDSAARQTFPPALSWLGVPTWKIRQQTGHASDAMLSRYVRDGELFIGNAVSALL